MKNWGIQKKDKIVNENKFPNDFKINEGNCLDIYKYVVKTSAAEVWSRIGIYRPFGFMIINWATPSANPWFSLKTKDKLYFDF